jgi:hypothetical protein
MTTDDLSFDLEIEKFIKDMSELAVSRDTGEGCACEMPSAARFAARTIVE